MTEAVMKVSGIARSIGILLTLGTYVEGAGPHVNVFKSRTCSCCSKWVENPRANGFTVNVKEVDSTAVYQRQHFPATDIQRLLKTRPTAKCLAVPGMPMGSPGMEGPRSESYSVLLFRFSRRA